MKNIFFLLFIVGSLHLSAQKIDGFYSGVLHNDSAKMIQQYELAIAMYKGKITGYSYVTFIVNDTFYYGIRKVKGEIVRDSLVIEDDKMVSNNFPESPAKGVKRKITIPLRGQDSIVSLNGSWQTNRTKKYYSVPGTIELNKSTDSLHSPLINHLKELKIIGNNYVATETTATVKLKDDKKKEIIKDIKVDETKTTKQKLEEKEEKKKIKPEPKPATVKAVHVKLSYNERTTIVTQTFDVTSDSLILAFYDNGVVDGDSVSVYLNGQNIVSNLRLTTTAAKKTIKVPGNTELQLLLVAENLGSLPPNTGLLIIKDGEKIYQVNFSADMQTNASIILRRKN
jgi:hypothetical protein